jgi:hypothetical protein
MQLGKPNMTQSKICQNFNLGSNFRENFPKGNFPAKNQNVVKA